MNIIIMPRAEKELIFFQKTEKKMFTQLVQSIDELQEKGLSASNIKALSGMKNAYRKRTGRERILFTIELDNNVLKIWIIAIEKDTKKDYAQWLEYLASKMG